MKNLALYFLLFAIVFSAGAQDAKHNLVFKGYVTFIKSNNPSGNTDFYGFTNFQIGGPAFALAITRGKGNYHQIELCDLKLDVSNQPAFFPGPSTHFSIGFRYSYNISLLKTQDGKLKTFIAIGTHLLRNYQSNKYFDLPAYPIRYSTINGELYVAPVISYSVCRHFSIEANFPLTFFGFTEEFYHNLDPSAADKTWRQDDPYLGSQYFYGRIGLALNL
ncbi:MAG TPA: hypothetical protein VE978_17090 [Chitinophagales bacterium]|nr:hypothetical protein [Chitinophagales bacterium]